MLAVPDTAIVRRAEQGDDEATKAVLLWLEKNPDIWDKVGDLALRSQDKLIDGFAGANRVIGHAIKRKRAALREDLVGSGGDPLQRLLVERILTCWLYVHRADHRHAAFLEEGGSRLDGDYYSAEVDRAQLQETVSALLERGHETSVREV